MPYDRAQALLLERKMVEALNSNSINRANMKMEMQKISGLAQLPPVDGLGVAVPTADLDRVYDDVKAKIEALLNVGPGPSPGP